MNYSVCFLYYSFQSPLPWSPEAFDLSSNFVNPNFSYLTKPVLQQSYFHSEILDASNGLDDFGSVSFKLLIGLAVSWLAVYLTIIDGIYSSGKIAIFTALIPFPILLILMFRALSLEGASEGLKFLFILDFQKLFSPTVWIKAGIQAFFQLGIGFGTFINFASHNDIHQELLHPSILIPLGNVVASIISTFVVFPVLGFISQINEVPIEELQIGGAALAFETYPTALAMMPYSNFFSVIFFLNLIFLGIDSEVNRLFPMSHRLFKEK